MLDAIIVLKIFNYRFLEFFQAKIVDLGKGRVSCGSLIFEV